ncbi:MAG TPA: protein-tyrosine phosphatase family protein [Anaeromyxobacteraceae bacterium]
MTVEMVAGPPVAFVAQEPSTFPGRLGFCPAPGRWRAGDALQPDELVDGDLAALCDCGATVLVVLLEEEEMSRIGLARLLERARSASLEVLWFPIPDGAAPSDLGAAVRLVERILERLSSGRTVVVHCHGGIGRSGTIAAATLVASGSEPGTALERVREARPGAATAPGQEEFVYAFAAAWAQRSG